jgi:tripartite-type tricarboxylate transporter receptor subunit TctC
MERAMGTHRRSFLGFLAATVALPILPSIAFGLEYPTRPVRLIVGFAPGGAPDLIGRLVGQWLSERLGQTFVVENRPGVGSNLALQEVGRAPPDGYTLFEVTIANATNVSLYPDASIEGRISPVASIATAAYVLVVNPSFPAKTVPDLMAHAKSEAGKLNFGSSPTGTPPYLAVTLFKKMADVDAVQVPYRNSLQAIEELLAGRLDAAIADMSAMEYVKAGRLDALAVTTPMRQPTIPNVPALAEFLPGYEATSWYGLGVTKNTPPQIIKLLNTETDAALSDTAHLNRLVALGLTVDKRSPAEFGQYIADQTKKWAKVIKDANIKPQ